MPPRKIEPFSKVETKGEVRVMDLLGVSKVEVSRNRETREPLSGRLITSVYANYIPLTYILRMPSCLQTDSNYDLWAETGDRVGLDEEDLESDEMVESMEEFEGKWNNSYISRVALSGIETEGRAAVGLNNLKNWLHDDSSLSITDLQCEQFLDRAEATDYTNGYRVILNQRVYSALLDFYSMYYKNLTTSQGVFTPRVIAVSLPENYYYHRLSILKGRIDLSKIIILVDKDLDSPRFECQPFRQLYKETLLPHIMESGCQVWKVPYEYIVENCFHQSFNVRENNIFERQADVEEILRHLGEKDGSINNIEGYELQAVMDELREETEFTNSIGLRRRRGVSVSQMLTAEEGYDPHLGSNVNIEIGGVQNVAVGYDALSSNSSVSTSIVSQIREEQTSRSHDLYQRFIYEYLGQVPTGGAVLSTANSGSTEINQTDESDDVTYDGPMMAEE